jgi:hypothetical protein
LGDWGSSSVQRGLRAVIIIRRDIEYENSIKKHLVFDRKSL